MNGHQAGAPKPLPKFKKPPVVEVAISVFFKPLPNFRTADFGRFWELNKDYPTTEDQPPIIESATTELVQLPPLRRVFFITGDGNYILQIQPDFFAHNWRKMKPEDEYPSFERARGLFLDKWRLFNRFVAEHRLGDFQFTRYEVTYVNHLIEDPGTFPVAIEKYSPLIKLREGRPEHFLTSPKALLAELQFAIPNDLGHLRISFKQGVRAFDQKEVMQVDVIARNAAKPDGSDMEAWFEVAHEWIVRGFTDLTSAEAHRMWERFQ